MSDTAEATLIFGGIVASVGIILVLAAILLTDTGSVLRFLFLLAVTVAAGVVLAVVMYVVIYAILGGK